MKLLKAVCISLTLYLCCSQTVAEGPSVTLDHGGTLEGTTIFSEDGMVVDLFLGE